MNQGSSQLDEQLAGTTNPRRHRMRRLMGAISLVAIMAALALGMLALVRGALVSQQAERQQAQKAQREPVVTDEAAPQQEEEEPAPEEKATPDPVSLKIMMIGDVLMHDGVIYSGEREDGTFNYDHLFAHIVQDVQAADLAVLDQETILGGDRFAYAGYPQFNSPQALGDAEAAVGFDLILKGNNHTLDLGYEGVRAELAFWRERHPEMAVIGMADPDGNGICPSGTTSAGGSYLFEKDGLRVALLNYTYWLNSNVDESNDWRVIASMENEEAIRADLAAAREQADIVVVFPHWGNEYETWVSDQERYWASVFQEEGVDVVMGGHPHVIQPVEVLGEGDDRMLVFWSAGNFVSSMPTAERMVGGISSVTLVKDERGARVEGYEFMPVICHRVPYSTEQSTYRLPDYADELAQASTIGGLDPGCGTTQQWYVDYCASILGDAFDRETMSLYGTLG